MHSEDNTFSYVVPEINKINDLIIWFAVIEETELHRSLVKNEPL